MQFETQLIFIRLPFVRTTFSTDPLPPLSIVQFLCTREMGVHHEPLEDNDVIPLIEEEQDQLPAPDGAYK